MEVSLREKRLQKELKSITESKISGIDIVLNDENLAEWVIYIKGPVNTPYSGGTFQLVFQFPSNYPFKSPQVRFTTPIYHPNINSDGKVCISIFRETWSATTTIQNILLAIVSLLSYPDVADPLVPEIANMYKENYDKYIETAKKYTSKYAH